MPLYKGSTKIKELYKGSTLVYQGIEYFSGTPKVFKIVKLEQNGADMLAASSDGLSFKVIKNSENITGVCKCLNTNYWLFYYQNGTSFLSTNGYDVFKTVTLPNAYLPSGYLWFTNGLYYYTVSNGDSFWYSSDCINWTEGQFGGTSGGNKIWFVGQNKWYRTKSLILYTSSDGQNWTAKNSAYRWSYNLEVDTSGFTFLSVNPGKNNDVTSRYSLEYNGNLLDTPYHSDGTNNFVYDDTFSLSNWNYFLSYRRPYHQTAGTDWKWYKILKNNTETFELATEYNSFETSYKCYVSDDLQMCFVNIKNGTWFLENDNFWYYSYDGMTWNLISHNFYSVKKSTITNRTPLMG